MIPWFQLCHPASDQVIPTADLGTFWKAFKTFAVRPRVSKLLFATCFCWFCLDVPFYGLGLISPNVIGTIWYGENPPDRNVYESFVENSYQTMVVVSSGAIVGNLLAIFTIDYLGRRNIQLNGFFWLLILNVAIGATFRPLAENGNSSALIVMYVLSQVFFNFGRFISDPISYLLPVKLTLATAGPNTTTYIVSPSSTPITFSY